MPSQLQVGVARVDITPPVGIAHANWGAQKHERAAGIDMDLWATALVFSDGEQTAAIVDLDLGNIQRETADAARDAAAALTGIPREQIRISFTHTHSGPNTISTQTWVSGGAEMVQPYLDSLPSKIAGVIWQAHNAMQPARLAAGSGSCVINVNRRFRNPEGKMIVGVNPDGPVDREVQVLRFDTLAGEPLAVIAHYACHPTIVGPYVDLITPDYPGMVKRVVEATVGGTCLFLQSATGNVGPIEGCITPDTLSTYRRLGRILGAEAARVAVALETQSRQRQYIHTLESGADLAVYEWQPQPDPEPRLRLKSHTLNLPLREFRPVDELEAEADECHARLQQTLQSGTEAEIRAAAMQAKRSRKQAVRAGLFGGKSHEPLELQVMCINDVALLNMPGEPFVEIGQAIKAGSPFARTLFSGYCNGGGGYIPMPYAYDEGGYEAEDTPFAPEAAQVIIDESLSLLHALNA